jgi:hypothetical protein
MLLFTRRSPAPTAADATAVLAEVKVVRPTGRSTLTAAAGRRSQAAAPGRNDGAGQPSAAALLTISSVVHTTVRISVSNRRNGTNSGHAFAQSLMIAG